MGGGDLDIVGLGGAVFHAMGGRDEHIVGDGRGGAVMGDCTSIEVKKTAGVTVAPGDPDDGGEIGGGGAVDKRSLGLGDVFSGVGVAELLRGFGVNLCNAPNGLKEDGEGGGVGEEAMVIHWSSLFLKRSCEGIEHGACQG